MKALVIDLNGPWYRLDPVGSRVRLGLVGDVGLNEQRTAPLDGNSALVYIGVPRAR